MLSAAGLVDSSSPRRLPDPQRQTPDVLWCPLDQLLQWGIFLHSTYKQADPRDHRKPSYDSRLKVKDTQSKAYGHTGKDDYQTAIRTKPGPEPDTRKSPWHSLRTFRSFGPAHLTVSRGHTRTSSQNGLRTCLCTSQMDKSYPSCRIDYIHSIRPTRAERGTWTSPSVGRKTPLRTSFVQSPHQTRHL